MQALLEKTFLKVDVLTLRIRIDSTAAARVRAIVGRGLPQSVAEDSIAEAAMDSREILADMRFLRGISLEQFLGGIDDDMRQAVRVGLLEEEAYHQIMDDLPVSFSFLRDRRIQKGDRVSYRIHDDTLRTTYMDAEGKVLLDQVDVGRQRRLSVIATYFARGSSFRERLLSSAFH